MTYKLFSPAKRQTILKWAWRTPTKDWEPYLFGNLFLMFWRHHFWIVSPVTWQHGHVGDNGHVESKWTEVDLPVESRRPRDSLFCPWEKKIRTNLPLQSWWRVQHFRRHYFCNSSKLFLSGGRGDQAETQSSFEATVSLENNY